MAKQKRQLTPDEVTELFSELDDSGVLDPSRKRRDIPRPAIDPLSGDDPSGSKVDSTISRAAVGFILIMLALVLGMQIWYGVSRRLNTANLSESVNFRTVSSALEGGVEWGDGFTQFPRAFTVDEADERSGLVEVTVVNTTSANEIELFSNSLIQAAALATNALLNDDINQVVYNVDARFDDDGKITHDSVLGLLPASGTERTVFTFIWTKHRSDRSSNIDWEVRVIGMDEKTAAAIQEQVNSVSSLIEDPNLTQDELDAQAADRAQQLVGGTALPGVAGAGDDAVGESGDDAAAHGGSGSGDAPEGPAGKAAA